MDRPPFKLVTLVAEHVLEDRLVEDLVRLGARGWSASEVRGSGEHWSSAADPDAASVRIEALVSAGVAERILEHIAAEYFGRYHVVAWTVDATVVRGAKFA